MGFICNYCEKEYSSYQSRCNHIRNIHNKKDIQNIQSNIQNIQSNIQSNIQNIQSNIQNKCIKCNKILCNYYSKWRHEKTCKGTNKLEDTEIQ